MAFVKLTRLNDRGEAQGEVHLNPDQVVGIIGSEEEVKVTVVTTAGTFDIQQIPPPPPVVPGEEPVPVELPPSVLSQLGG